MSCLFIIISVIPKGHGQGYTMMIAFVQYLLLMRVLSFMFMTDFQRQSSLGSKQLIHLQSFQTELYLSGSFYIVRLFRIHKLF